MTASRSEINRANAQSPGNPFRHGPYSQDLIIQGEDPAEFDHLRATLRDEHQPANTTEEILVDELAQHFWRMRRFRELEARALQPENLDTWCNNGLPALIQRSMDSAERSFHKSLAALMKLQKQRGFVPPKPEPDFSHIEIIEIDDDAPAEENICLAGFVPSKTPLDHDDVEGDGFLVAHVLDVPCRDFSRH